MLIRYFPENFIACLCLLSSLALPCLLSGAETSSAAVRDPIYSQDSFQRGSIPPQESLISDIRKNFPEWSAMASKAYTSPLYSGPPAWYFILTRPINPQAAKETSIKNAFFFICIVQNSASINPLELKEFITTDIPHTELTIYHLYLGSAHGYHWYVKGDIFHINRLRDVFKIDKGEDYFRIMAQALNTEDFDHFSARTAIVFFNNKGDQAVPYLVESANKWVKQKHEPPMQHLEALKLAGGPRAGRALMRAASSRNREIAGKAIDLLLTPPYLATDEFMRKVLYIPEFTPRVLEIYAKQNKLKSLLDDLKEITLKPQSITQYAVAVEARRKITLGIATVPEIKAATHIKYRMVRLGETANSNKFISVDENYTSEAADKAERKRIQSELDRILKSKDTEASIAAGLLLASLDQGDEDFLAKSYLDRVHKLGVEILQQLPPKQVQPVILRMLRSVRDEKSRQYMATIAKEMGIAQ